MRQMAAGELDEWNTEKRYVRPDGEVRWGALRALMLHDAEGRSTHCLALLRDVTEQRAAERCRAAAHGVLRVMAGGRELRDALPELLRIVVEELGWERGSLWLDGALEAAWPGGSAPERSAGDLAIPLDGGWLVLDGAGQPPGAEFGAQLGEFIVRRRAEEQRLHEALHDPLTGLPNRVLFFDRLDHAMRRQQREHAPLAVLFLDFDGFKAVNDRFGHAGGDDVLRSAAARVASTMRAEDTVARFGGDELVVLSEHITGVDDVRGIAQRILDALREPIALGDEHDRAVGQHRDLRRAGRGPQPRGAAQPRRRRDVPRQGRRARALPHRGLAGVPFPPWHVSSAWTRPVTRRSRSGRPGTPRRSSAQWPSSARSSTPATTPRSPRARGRRGRSLSCRSTPTS